VWEVELGSTAEQAGVKPGDVLVEFGGQRVATSDELTAAVGRTTVGGGQTLAVVRDGQQLRLAATMRRAPSGGLSSARTTLPPLAFREVVPGRTKAAEVLKSPRWKPLVREDNLPDGSTRLEFRLPPWRRVVLTVSKDVVQAIDATPPEGAAPEATAAALKLGQLLPLDSLPPAARMRLPIAKDWRPSRCSQAAGVVVFTVKAAIEPVVTVVRFYAEDVGDKVQALLWRPRSLAVEQRDVVLVTGVDQGLATALRQIGIETIDQFLRDFD
jgi:hypothetical protein